MEQAVILLKSEGWALLIGDKTPLFRRFRYIFIGYIHGNGLLNYVRLVVQAVGTNALWEGEGGGIWRKGSKNLLELLGTSRVTEALPNIIYYCYSYDYFVGHPQFWRASIAPCFESKMPEQCPKVWTLQWHSSDIYSQHRTIFALACALSVSEACL